jgi:hypothetical protein
MANDKGDVKLVDDSNITVPDTNKEVVTKVAEPLSGKPDMKEYGTIGMNVILQGISGPEAFPVEDVPLSKLLQMVRVDGSVAGLLSMMKLPIQASEFDIEEFDQKSKTEAAWVHQNLTFPPQLGGMSNSLRYIFGDMVMACVTGFRVYEKVWDLRGGMYVLDKLAPRNPLTVRIKQDVHGNFDGFVQRMLAGTAALAPAGAFMISSANDKVILKDKAVLFVRNKEENPLYGRSDFLPVWYHYDKIHKLYYIAHLAYQLEAIPMRIGTYPRDADKGDVDRFFQNIAKLGFDAAMMKREGFDVKEFGAQRASSDKMGLINHHKIEMFTALTAQFMNLGNAGRTTGTATKTFSGIFLMTLEALQAQIDDCFNNEVIPQMVDYNFGSRKYPRMKHRPLDTTKQEAIQNIFMKLMASPADHATPEFILGIEEELSTDLGLNIDYSVIRAKRLAELVKQSIEKGQLEKQQAAKQLIDTFHFSEPDEDGVVMAYPSNKTYDVIQALMDDQRSQLESECKKAGIDLSKLAQADIAA